MKKFLFLLVLCQTVLFPAGLVHADDYADCKERCAQQYADCMNQPRASEPEEQVAKEAACSKSNEGCNAECEKLRPVNEDMGPGNYRNLTRK